MKRASLFSLAFLLTVLSPGLPAQDYPARPIRVLVASGTGGGLDFVARLIAPRLGEYLGQSVVVDNRPGASGSIAVELTVNAAPDGYTLVFMSATSLVHSMLVKVPYDILRDLTPVSQVAAGPYVLLVNPALPVKSVAELIAYTKANPGKLNYASTGNGSLIHLATELLRTMTGTDMVHVPFKGMGAAYPEMLAGRVQMTLVILASGFPLMRAQRLRALAVTSAVRAKSAPEIPTMIEAGIPGFVVTQWHAMLAPRGVQQAVVERLYREIVRTLNQPDIASRLATDGTDAIGSTPRELAVHLKSEREKWGRAIKQSGIKVE